MASGALRHFLDRGAAEPNGLLSLGWFGPYPPLVQTYSGPASPYWASKGFVGLLLPPDHPVWTEPETAAPVERGDAVHPLPAPGWLIQSTAADGLVRLHNHGSDDQPVDQVLPDDPLYARLGYSTATGPLPDGAPDNQFALVVDGEIGERGRITPLGTGDGWAASAHRPRIGGAELPGVTVTSLVLAHGAEEVHAHLVAGATPGTTVRHSGWAVAGTGVETRSEGLLGRATAYPDGTDGTLLDSALLGVAGYTAATAERRPGGTAFGPMAALPVLTGTTDAGRTVFVSAARLSRSLTPPFADLRVRVEGPVVRVTWADGSEHEARLDADGPTVHRKG